MPVSWTQTRGSFSRYFSLFDPLSLQFSITERIDHFLIVIQCGLQRSLWPLQLYVICTTGAETTFFFVGLWYNWRPVLEDTTKISPGSISFGKSWFLHSFGAVLVIYCSYFCVLFLVGVPPRLRAAFPAGITAPCTRGLQSGVLLPPQSHRNWLCVLCLSLKWVI